VWQAVCLPPDAYPLGMSNTPLMLSALATSAVPGFQAVSAQQMSSAERDAALVYDVNGQAWIVELPTSAPEQERALDRLSAARALTEGIRSRLTFAVPRVAGTTEVGGRILSVNEYLPGQSPRPKTVTPALAAALGHALAEIHQLPTSTLMDHHRPASSALDSLRDAAGIVDQVAATGFLPQSLLRRWETACEDRGLWQFESTAMHGLLQLDRFLVENERVVAISGWRTFGIGDPAHDLAWLTTPNNQPFAAAVFTAYRSARNSTDRWVMHRARFWAELDIARWLMHGITVDNETIVHDATAMLAALNDRVAGDMDQALTQPISQQKHPLAR